VNRKGVEVRSSNLAYREATPEERAIKLRKPPSAANAKAMKPGPYTVRVGIENKSRAVAGSVFADLDVPDFTSTLALSGVIVGSSSAPPHAEIDSLRLALPFAPTAQRTFASTDRVTAMVRIYENGGQSFPVTMRTMIRNKADMAVYDRTESLPADRFATDGRTDFRFDVPLASLLAGPSLLSFEAAGYDKVVRREVVFLIR
jgi:hypothetical protein